MKDLADRIRDILIEMAINDELPLDLTQLNMDTVLEKAYYVPPKDEIIYVAEDGERKYTFNDVVELAKGNLNYAHSLIERVVWQGIETLIEEDIREGEVVEFNDQYILTGGEEIEIKKV